MTIGEALERAEQLRPNCRIETETRLQWLREADALLRTKLFDRAAAGAFDAVGADLAWPAEAGLDDAVDAAGTRCLLMRSTRITLCAAGCRPGRDGPLRRGAGAV